jgi:hypothetical protein
MKLLHVLFARKTSIESYWETSGITETEHFRDVMPRNRFQSIVRYLHCSDNETAIPRGQVGYDQTNKVFQIYTDKRMKDGFKLKKDNPINMIKHHPLQ